MINAKCDACHGEYDARFMVPQGDEVIYCPCCDYEKSAKLDNLTDEE